MSANIKELHKALLAIPEDEQDYASRFVKANKDLTSNELQQKYDTDMASRKEANDREAHRKLKVTKQFLELSKEDRAEAMAMVNGAQSELTVSETKTI